MRMCDSRLESTAVGKWRQHSREQRETNARVLPRLLCSALLFLLLHHSDFPVQGMALPAVALKQFPHRHAQRLIQCLLHWDCTWVTSEPSQAHAEGLCSCSLTCPTTTVTMDFGGTQTCVHRRENCSSWCNQAFQSLGLLWLFLTVIDSFFSLPCFWKVT